MLFLDPKASNLNVQDFKDRWERNKVCVTVPLAAQCRELHGIVGHAIRLPQFISVQSRCSSLDDFPFHQFALLKGEGFQGTQPLLGCSKKVIDIDVASIRVGRLNLERESGNDPAGFLRRSAGFLAVGHGDTENRAKQSYTKPCYLRRAVNTRSHCLGAAFVWWGVEGPIGGIVTGVGGTMDGLGKAPSNPSPDL